MIEARGDLAVFHEISTSPWFLQKYGKERWVRWFRKEQPTTFDSLKQTLLTTLQKTDVFVKDMIVPALAFLKHEQELIRSPHTHFVFLIRHPHPCLISYYKLCRHQGQSVDILELENFLGYQSMLELYTLVRENGANPPLFVRSEDLCNTPRTTIEEFCRNSGIPFIEDSLTWNSEDANSYSLQKTLNDPYKKLEIGKVAHGEAIKSSEFHPLTEYEIDERQAPTFTEVDLANRPQIMEIYNRCMKIYHVILGLNSL